MDKGGKARNIGRKDEVRMPKARGQQPPRFKGKAVDDDISSSGYSSRAATTRGMTRRKRDEDKRGVPLRRKIMKTSKPLIPRKLSKKTPSLSSSSSKSVQPKIMEDKKSQDTYAVFEKILNDASRLAPGQAADPKSLEILKNLFIGISQNDIAKIEKILLQQNEMGDNPLHSLIFNRRLDIYNALECGVFKSESDSLKNTLGKALNQKNKKWLTPLYFIATTSLINSTISFFGKKIIPNIEKEFVPFCIRYACIDSLLLFSKNFYTTRLDSNPEIVKGFMNQINDEFIARNQHNLKNKESVKKIIPLLTKIYNAYLENALHEQRGCDEPMIRLRILIDALSRIEHTGPEAILKLQEMKPASPGMSHSVYFGKLEKKIVILKSINFNDNLCPVFHQMQGVPKGEAHLVARNIASWNLAQRLGFPTLIAKAESTVVQSPNGSYSLGIMMDYAKGDEAYVTLEKLVIANEAEKLFALGSFRKKLTQLQWIDALSWEVDRHAHNFFIHRDGNDEVSILGTDNDNCFGSEFNPQKLYTNFPSIPGIHKSKRLEEIGYASSIALPHVIDVKMATQILSLKNIDVSKISGSLLTSQEQMAFIHRIGIIQTHIRILEFMGRVISGRNLRWAQDDVENWLEESPKTNPPGSPLYGSDLKYSSYYANHKKTFITDIKKLIPKKTSTINDKPKSPIIKKK